jgi:hypothetical protein
MKAEVITSWVGDGISTETAHRPKIADDYTIWCKDTTGQDAANLHPNPNMYIVQIECDQATLDAIEADSNYQVLWYE